MDMRTFRGRDSSDAQVTQLESNSFENAEEGEKEFVERLNANPDLLINEPVLLIGHEHGFDIGRLDLLGLDEFGNTIVFEVKTGKSGTKSASEATILSQPQYYSVS
jgi:RecB family endonuclease NucS